MLDQTEASSRREEQTGRPTVVIVDREVLYRWFVAESLDPFGIQVMQFRTAADAALYADGRLNCALILVDAQTLADGGLGGIEALHARFPSLPCVVLELHGPLSAQSLLDETLTAEKPVDSGSLVTLVDAYLHRSPRCQNVRHP